MTKLTKLITLEDIELENGFDSLRQVSKGYPEKQQYQKFVEGYKGKAIFVEDLRKEATKWIKDLSIAYRFNEIINWEIFKRELDVKLIEKQDPALFVIQWIINFFNITDEMLDKETIKG